MYSILSRSNSSRQDAAVARSRVVMQIMSSDKVMHQEDRASNSQCC